MKYIIMCGGDYNGFVIPKQLQRVNNEVIVERTIRLLKENGIDDISISTTNPVFEYLNIPILKHNNDYKYNSGESKGWWLDGFYLTDEPTCYIFGDVYFSENAIKKIVKTETDDIELFGSAPPFADDYCKNYIEAFAVKVVNTNHLKEAIEETKELARQGKTWRKNPIIWELWTVIKDTPLQTEYGKYLYNYVAINDYTTDVDDERDINLIENFMRIGGNKMIRVEVIKEFTLGDFYKIKDSIKRKSKSNENYLYVGDTFICDKEMMGYLTGNNAYKTAFVKVIEVIPEAKIEEPKIDKVKEALEEITKEQEVKAEFSMNAKPGVKITKKPIKKTTKKKK